jgi:hypothetical protein
MTKNEEILGNLIIEISQIKDEEKAYMYARGASWAMRQMGLLKTDKEQADMYLDAMECWTMTKKKGEKA